MEIPTTTCLGCGSQTTSGRVMPDNTGPYCETCFDQLTIPIPHAPSQAELFRDEGIIRVTEHNPEWVSFGLTLLRSLPPGMILTGETIRDLVEKEIGPPAHYNAVGALVNWACRKWLIEPTGLHPQRQRPASHASCTPQYRVTGLKQRNMRDEPLIVGPGGLAEYTFNPVCPECGHVETDPGDIDFEGVPNGTEVEYACPECGEDYQVSQFLAVTFTTRRMPK